MRTYNITGKVPPSLLFKVILSSSEGHKRQLIKLLSKIIDWNYEIHFFNYGRSALEIVFRMFKGKKIIFPAFICPYIPKATITSGAIPVFVDVNLDDFNLNVEELRRTDFNGISALFCVHTFGVPCNLKDILEITDKHDVYLVEDAAQALFAKYEDRYVGSFGDIVLFSMYKQIPNLHGAILLTKIDKIKLQYQLNEKEKLDVSNFIKLIYITNGWHQNLITLLRRHKSASDKVDMWLPKSRKPSELTKALFSELSKDLEKIIAKKNILARYYLKRVKDSKYLIHQRHEDDVSPSWFNFSVRLRPELSSVRDGVINKLRKKGIFCERSWYDSPVMLDEFNTYLKGKYPNAALLAKTVINLPIWHSYSKEDVDYIFNSIDEIIYDLKKGCRNEV